MKWNAAIQEQGRPVFAKTKILPHTAHSSASNIFSFGYGYIVPSKIGSTCIYKYLENQGMVA